MLEKNDKKEARDELELELDISFNRLETVLGSYPDLCKHNFNKMKQLEKEMTEDLTNISKTVRWLYGFYSLFPNSEDETNIYHHLDLFVKNKIDINLEEKIDKYFKSIEKCRLLTRYSSLVNNTNVTPKCAICLTEDIRFFMMPCGHTGCKKCLMKINKCFLCRKKITKIKPIYCTFHFHYHYHYHYYHYYYHYYYRYHYHY